MKTSRMLAVPAIAAVSLLALTGCFQLPPMGGATTGTDATTEPDGGSDDGSGDTADLAGTSWTGDFNGQVSDIAFTLNEDGTIDFSDWAGDTFDSPADVWSQDGDTIEMTITQISVDETGQESFDVTLSGSAADGSMELSGQGTDGGDYELSASQG
ncbi:hypothetical protein OVA14_00170 [Agrococcus sp. SL85]|uniref:hypothetical protein n=1 Tax=Agrococcus sp. SL85 TaxID=2995141 RepID=UPI00226CE28C|nr:hypothetical protein [Agrococcus sp. SL85]WAC66261.1 hypothetical protein OVA14_00170 [Agrococcus sp. SL85]